jgi:hypothetical protein
VRIGSVFLRLWLLVFLASGTGFMCFLVQFLCDQIMILCYWFLSMVFGSLVCGCVSVFGLVKEMILGPVVFWFLVPACLVVFSSSLLDANL